MLRTGARFFSKFSGCSARERDFLQKFQNARHGSASFLQHFQDAPHGSAILEKFQDAPHGSAFLNDGVANPMKIGLLNQENHLERRTPGLVWYRTGIDFVDIIFQK